MKLTHKLEPFMQAKEKSDNILTFGCIQVNLVFMLKPEGPITQDETIAIMTKMMKAACDVIEEHNKQEDINALSNPAS